MPGYMNNFNTSAAGFSANTGRFVDAGTANGVEEGRVKPALWDVLELAL